MIIYDKYSQACVYSGKLIIHLLKALVHLSIAATCSACMGDHYRQVPL